jgi:hypothetical protein
MSEGLPVLVSLVGLAVAAIGLLGIVAPTRLTRILSRQRILTGLPVTLTVRFVTGTIFVVAAPDCRAPTLVRLIGLLEFGGAAGLLGLGGERLGRFVEWWLARSSSFVRYWSFGALTLGALILYSGA